MKYNPDIHHRHSIRLKGYDYSSNGMYYITICTQDRENLFGEIVAGTDFVSAQILLSEAGKMVENVLRETAESYPAVTADKYVIMPNHIHLIMTVSGTKTKTGADTRSAPTGISIGEIMQTFKSKTTLKYAKGVKSGIHQPFNKRLWQRNYYEHIIRDEEDYLTKWYYIEQNPAKWTEDEYNKSI